VTDGKARRLEGEGEHISDGEREEDREQNAKAARRALHEAAQRPARIRDFRLE
jgi:hypothetical protein